MKKMISAMLISFVGVIAYATCDLNTTPTVTTRLGLSEPTINACGWGTTTNNNWSIVDSSVALITGPNTFTSDQTIGYGKSINFQTSSSGSGISLSNPFGLGASALRISNGSSIFDINGSNISITPNASLTLGGQEILSSVNCNTGTHPCYSYQDTLTNPNGSGSSTYSNWSSSLYQQSASSMYGLYFQPTIYQQVNQGFDYHDIFVSYISSFPIGGSAIGVDVQPVDSSTGTLTHVGVQVQMGALGSIHNSHATKVTGHFTGGVFIVEGSSTNAYSLIVTTENPVSYNLSSPSYFHVAISTSGHFITSLAGSKPSISSCGTGSPSVLGDDNEGTITTGTGSPTACTLNFVNSWGITPTCVISDSLTTVTPDISAISSSSFTVSLSGALTSGSIFYRCGCSGTGCR